jgi:hypothetical protein
VPWGAVKFILLPPLHTRVLALGPVALGWHTKKGRHPRSHISNAARKGGQGALCPIERDHPSSIPSSLSPFPFTHFLFCRRKAFLPDPHSELAPLPEYLAKESETLTSWSARLRGEVGRSGDPHHRTPATLLFSAAAPIACPSTKLPLTSGSLMPDSTPPPILFSAAALGRSAGVSSF